MTRSEYVTRIFIALGIFAIAAVSQGRGSCLWNGLDAAMSVRLLVDPTSSPGAHFQCDDLLGI